MKSWTIVGYTYQADVYCPSCTAAKVTANPGDAGHGTRAPLHRRTREQAEAVIASAARIAGIDAADETSFDSGDFPKVIFAGMVEAHDRCGLCNGALLELP